MKKVLSLLLMTVLLIALFSGCGADGKKLTLYFKAENSNELKKEKRIVDVPDGAGVQTLARTAVNELFKGPKEEGNDPVISKQAKLISLAVKENVATVNVSEHFLEKKNAEQLVLRVALVNTLCSIKGIDGVVIQVDGKNLVSETTGKEIGVLRKDDNVVFAPEDKLSIKLYFPNENYESLEKEVRDISVQNALSMEKIVLGELLKGPEGAGLVQSIPAGTKLVSVEIKDKVCFVNFSKEFVSGGNSGSASTRMALYSVVNTLCSLSGIESVQILINGEAGIEFGNYVLDIPYEPDYTLVK